MIVKKVSDQDTWAIRGEILRPGKPLSTCQFEEDQLAEAVHFTSVDANRQTGVVSAYPIPFPQQNALTDCWQLRAMATIVVVRGQGHGAALVGALEDYLHTRSARWLWCNARQEAIGFYVKCGFELRGDEFDIAGIGPHRTMLKSLDDKALR